MKISRITVWELALPLAHPYFLSGGRLKFECLDSVPVRVETACGMTGWGEGCPWGRSYLPVHGEQEFEETLRALDESCRAMGF